MQARIFSDGASKGNPGPSGWGVIVYDGADLVVELGGGTTLSTNNHMELKAVIEGLKRLAPGCVVEVCSDSTYVIQGMRSWVASWKKRNWMTSSGSPVVNRELWQELDVLVAERRVSWRHVRGHSGIPANERADAIAQAFALGQHFALYEGPLARYTVSLDPGVAAPAHAKKGKAYSYLSLVDGVLDRHRDWAACKRRVDGHRGARYRKALSAEHESEILKEWGLN